MKMVIGFLTALVAMIVVLVGAGMTFSYILILTQFTGPGSVAESCFEIGFSLALICALAVGFFIVRHFWREYSSSEPE